LIHGLSQAFAARGYLEEVLAAYPFTGNVTQGGGINHYGLDAGWSNFEHSSVGTSARWGFDGEAACAAMWNPEGDMGDVEAWELIEPLLYLGRRIRPNTGGPGKQRGGSGFESVRMIYGTRAQTMFHCNNGHVFSTPGLFGGYPAATAYRHTIRNTDMKERIEQGLPYPIADCDPEDSQIEAHVRAEHTRDRRCHHYPYGQKEYDLYLSILNGGHGLGDVLERDPKDVVEDLDSMQLLPRFAESTYGVVAHREESGKWRFDPDATRERRAEMRKERLARSVSVEEWKARERPRVQTMDFIEPIREAYQQSIELSESWARFFRSFWDLPEDWTPGESA
jgi:N-methylhydantoinase B/acetone carboxylase alpha subunit